MYIKRSAETIKRSTNCCQNPAHYIYIYIGAVGYGCACERIENQNWNDNIAIFDAATSM